MRLKNIFTLALILIVAISCNNEELLTAKSQKESVGLQFPENTKFDNITNEIYEKYDVKIFWGNQLSSSDVNRAWTSTSGKLFFNYLNEEQAGIHINFLNDYIFSCIDPTLFNKALKPNIYLLYDMNSLLWGLTYSPIKIKMGGIDNWLFSMFGEGLEKYPMYPTDLHIVPQTEAEILAYRRQIFVVMFNELYNKGVIKAPEVFSTEFSYEKLELKYNFGDAEDPLFFMNRGFCGNVNYSSGNLNALYNQNLSNEKNNFLSYVAMVYRYSKSDIESGAGVNGVPFKNYPRLLELYDLVDNYFINTYNYDLKQLQKILKK